jgi:Ca2+-binding RTX toxin-like protein
MRRTKLIGALVVALATMVVTPFAEAAELVGTPGADRIIATPMPDVIYAGSGDDSIVHVGSGDVVYAGSGRDVIQMAPGTVTGAVVDGNVGNDTFRANAGKVFDSTLIGGSGKDLITVPGCRNEVTLGSGKDRYENPEACPVPDSGTVDGGDDNDTISVLVSSRISGGNGHDHVMSRFPGTVVAGSGNDLVRLNLGGDAQIFLGAGNDETRFTNSANNTLYGDSGQDKIIGRTSNSHIDTQSGEDRIELDPRAKNNTLDGGANYDSARLAATNTGTTCRSLETILGPDGDPREC